jgi:hypothetical protein
MPKFIQGLELNQGFFHDVVEPLMQEHFPDLRYSAGLVGHGSDVMGFDTKTSVDHDWGPRLHLFFSDQDFVAYKGKVDEMLRKKLPYSYKGFSTNFADGGLYLKHAPKLKKSGPVNHIFEFWTLRSYFKHYLGFDVSQKPRLRDWLLFPQQALVELTGGRFFRDDLNVEAVRKEFAYYPDEIWKYMLRIQWGKILDELQMQARNGEAGDEVGAQVIAARTVQKIMLMCFLMERRYAPYSKWFGTAFRSWLRCADDMYPILEKILAEPHWKKRQKLLATAYQKLGKMHNALNLTKPVSTDIVDFFGRGYPIIDAWKFVEALEESIRNPNLKDMKYPLGSVDQFIDHARINHLDYFYRELGDVIK